MAGVFVWPFIMAPKEITNAQPVAVAVTEWCAGIYEWRQEMNASLENSDQLECLRVSSD